MTNGPLVFCASAEGFKTGPENPMIIAATANIRSNISHHGVLSASTSVSLSPSKSDTAGNRRLIGAGGTARSKNHRTGNTIKPSNSHGAPNAMLNMANI
jgi:hypothetical protein